MQHTDRTERADAGQYQDSIVNFQRLSYDQAQPSTTFKTGSQDYTGSMAAGSFQLKTNKTLSKQNNKLPKMSMNTIQLPEHINKMNKMIPMP